MHLLWDHILWKIVRFIYNFVHNVETFSIKQESFICVLSLFDTSNFLNAKSYDSLILKSEKCSKKCFVDSMLKCKFAWYYQIAILQLLPKLVRKLFISSSLNWILLKHKTVYEYYWLNRLNVTFSCNILKWYFPLSNWKQNVESILLLTL